MVPGPIGRTSRPCGPLHGVPNRLGVARLSLLSDLAHKRPGLLQELVGEANRAGRGLTCDLHVSVDHVSIEAVVT